MNIEITLEEFNEICWEQFNLYSLLWREIDISTSATPCGIDPKFKQVINDEFWNII